MDARNDPEREWTFDPLLTPEEHVITLLEEHNGRIRQQDIVAQTDYAAGTVSQLLSEMEDDGQITRYWKGDGKVVAVPELGPDAAMG